MVRSELFFYSKKKKKSHKSQDLNLIFATYNGIKFNFNMIRSEFKILILKKNQDLNFALIKHNSIEN